MRLAITMQRYHTSNITNDQEMISQGQADRTMDV